MEMEHIAILHTLIPQPLSKILDTNEPFSALYTLIQSLLDLSIEHTTI